jgi:hypothetical protein
MKSSCLLVLPASYMKLFGNIRLQVNYIVGIFFHSKMIKPGFCWPEQLLISMTCGDDW